MRGAGLKRLGILLGIIIKKSSMLMLLNDYADYTISSEKKNSFWCMVYAKQFIYTVFILNYSFKQNWPFTTVDYVFVKHCSYCGHDIVDLNTCLGWSFNFDLQFHNSLILFYYHFTCPIGMLTPSSKTDWRAFNMNVAEQCLHEHGHNRL